MTQEDVSLQQLVDLLSMKPVFQNDAMSVILLNQIAKRMIQERGINDDVDKLNHSAQ